MCGGDDDATTAKQTTMEASWTFEGGPSKYVYVQQRIVVNDVRRLMGSSMQRPAAFGDAAGECGAEEGDESHDEHPKVAEENEFLPCREGEEGARECGAERAGEALSQVRKARAVSECLGERRMEKERTYHGELRDTVRNA